MIKTPSLWRAPKFKVCQCPKCGGIQVSESQDRLKCVYCNTSAVFRVRGGWNVKVFKMTDSCEESAKFCRMLKDYGRA
jgi:hypothetical protein